MATLSVAGVSGGVWTLVRGEGPIVAVALHDGHQVGEGVARHLALSEVERLREEDPRTADWVGIAPTHIAVHRSRFEVDLNRPFEGAVYLGPHQAWNLQVWRDGTPPPEIVETGREIHRAFYSSLWSLLSEIEARHGRFVVYDLHSYNHRRGGPGSPPADLHTSPDINLGTGSMDRERWKPVVEAFLGALSGVEVAGRPLEVGENVRFEGGYLAEWVHRSFPRSGCALAVEVKKIFMDEWTGEIDDGALAAVREALARTVAVVQEAVERL
jgi:N-formylglutamate amidohydrolase